jgi:hypothetical protein
LRVGIVRQSPFDTAGRFRADECNERHGRLSGRPGELLVEAEIGIEEHEVGGECRSRQLRPAFRRFEADRRELAQDRVHGRMGAMQDEGLRPAECGDARGAAHDTTFRRGRPKISARL